MIKDGNKKKAILTNIILVPGICLFVILAICFPGYYESLYDNRLENKVTYEDARLMVYEADYESFYDKLYAIALCRNEGITLKTLKVNEYDAGISDDELLEVVKKELDECFANNIFQTKIKMSKAKLVSRELCTLYAADGNKEFRNINFYQVIYKTKDCNLTLYVDSEYYKIYDMELDMSDKTKSLEKYIVESKDCNDNTCMVGIAEYKNYYDIDKGNTIAIDTDDESFHKKNELMLAYLGLDNCSWEYSYVAVTDSNKKVVERNKKGCSITVELEEKRKMDITQYEWEDTDEIEHWEIGVGIKEYLD